MSKTWSPPWRCPKCFGVLCRKNEGCTEGEAAVWRNLRDGEEVFGYNDGQDGLWLSEGDTVGYVWSSRDWRVAS